MNDRTQDAPDEGDDERLIDYLYDELSPSERARFEAELAASPALVAELAAMRATRDQFAELPAVPMPRGLLDDVLLQADQQAAELHSQGRLHLPAEAAPSFWQRLAEGLRRLAFQPAFSMGMVFVLVAGVSLIATRNPSEIAGMELPRDVQRIPPMAMAPAPAAEPVPAEVAPALREEEAFVGELKSLEPAQAAYLADDGAEYPKAALAANKGELERAAPKADRARALRDQPGERQAAARPAVNAVSKETVGAVKKEAPAVFAEHVAASEGSATSEHTARAGASGAGLRPDVSDARTSAPMEARPAVQADTAADESDRAKRVVETVASKSSEAKVPERSANNQPMREASKLADDAAPASPPKPVAKPADAPPPAEPSSDRVYTTLSQQLAAGALADAEKSLAELAKLEGESARVKKARDVLAQAKVKAVKPPAETKPLPEPAKTPTP